MATWAIVFWSLLVTTCFLRTSRGRETLQCQFCNELDPSDRCKLDFCAKANSMCIKVVGTRYQTTKEHPYTRTLADIQNPIPLENQTGAECGTLDTIGMPSRYGVLQLDKCTSFKHPSDSEHSWWYGVACACNHPNHCADKYNIDLLRDQLDAAAQGHLIWPPPTTVAVTVPAVTAAGAQVDVTPDVNETPSGDGSPVTDATAPVVDAADAKEVEAVEETTAHNDSGASLSGGAIAGIVIGSIAGLALVVGGAFFAYSASQAKPGGGASRQSTVSSASNVSRKTNASAASKASHASKASKASKGGRA